MSESKLNVKETNGSVKFEKQILGKGFWFGFNSSWIAAKIEVLDSTPGAELAIIVIRWIHT